MLGIGCAPGAEVSLQLQPAIDEETGQPFVTADLKQLSITLSNGRIDDETTTISVALDRKAQSVLPPFHVDDPSAVQIDVWACPTQESCEKADVSFIGCTSAPLDLSSVNGVQPVVILLHPTLDARVRACPGHP